MSEREDHRAGHEVRRVVAAAPAATLRHDEMIRRSLGGAFYDVLRRRRDDATPQAPGAADGAKPGDVRGD